MLENRAILAHTETVREREREIKVDEEENPNEERQREEWRNGGHASEALAGSAGADLSGSLSPPGPPIIFFHLIVTIQPPLSLPETSGARSRRGGESSVRRRCRRERFHSQPRFLLVKLLFPSQILLTNE
jgi:hypothetical protein